MTSVVAVGKKNRGFHGSEGFQNVGDRVGSVHCVLKSHGSGRVGSRRFEMSRVGSGRVGSRGFEILRVGSGWVKRCGLAAGGGSARLLAGAGDCIDS